MPSHSSYVLLNGLRFHYLNWGGSGRPVVLLHGLASSARIWDFVAPRLAAHFRVLALDQRSHGWTDPAEVGWDFATITHDLQAFVEALALERPLLVGHSWGASTVLNYAARRPAGPAGVVMVDGGYTQLNTVPGLTWEKAEAMLRPPDLDGMPADEFRGRLRGWMGARYSDAIAEIVLANFRLDEADRLYRRLPIPHHMQIARALYELPTQTLFARARCPLLLCPAAPPAPRDEAAEQMLARKRAGVAQAQQAAAQARTLWFNDTPHDIPLFEPERLAEAIVEFGQALPD